MSPLRLPVVAEAAGNCLRHGGTAALDVRQPRTCTPYRAAEQLPGPLIPVAGANHFTIVHELRDAEGVLTKQVRLLA